MSRRLVSLTLDTLEELPRSCRRCVFWELDPVTADRALVSGDPALEKEAWVSQTLLEWGSCGKLAYVDAFVNGIRDHILSFHGDYPAKIAMAPMTA